MPRSLLLLLPLSICATTALADPSTPPLLYEQFETAVPHMDLETCPESLAQPETFCRATLQHDEFHVFVFSEREDSPMVGFASFSAEGLGALLK